MCALRTTKVKLKKGFSLNDWQLLHSKATFNSLDEPVGYKIEDVQKHNKKYDGWMVIGDKVFNVTPYIAYHPGGEKILEKNLGKDVTEEFNKFHKYINVEELLKKCCVGFYVRGDSNSSGSNSACIVDHNTTK